MNDDEQSTNSATVSAVAAAVGALVLALAVSPPTLGAERVREPEGRALLRFQWANDTFLNSDNQFTNGVAVQMHSRLFPTLDETSGTPAFGKSWARIFLPDDPAFSYRESWGFGQNMQTPQDITNPKLIVNDVPYAGMIGWSNTYAAVNDRSFVGFELLLGWMGPLAQAEKTQEAVHRALDFNDPAGWDHQLDDEPILNVYYMKKRKIVRTPRFDLALSFDAALGNFFTYGQGSVEMRFGQLPAGFAYVPTPIGRGLDFHADARSARGNVVYGSLVLRATRFLFALPRQGNRLRNGNAWTDLNTIEMEKLVGQAILGLHFERRTWGLHAMLWRSSDTIDRNGLASTQDPDNSFVVIAFDVQR